MSFRSSWWQARKARQARQARRKARWEAEEWARIAAARRFLFTKQEIKAWEQKSRQSAPLTIPDVLVFGVILLFVLFIFPMLVEGCVKYARS